MAEELDPKPGSAMEAVVGEGLVKSFKSLSPSEVKAWRAGKRREVSPEGRLPADSQALPEPSPWRAPLSAAETADLLLGRMWTQMRSDRDTYQKSLAFIRSKHPESVSYMTDAQLFEHLEGLARKYSERVVRRSGRWAPVRVP